MSDTRGVVARIQTDLDDVVARTTTALNTHFDEIEKILTDALKVQTDQLAEIKRQAQRPPGS